MLDVKFVASIAERDVDLLVMEELSVSTEFREWFSSRVFGEPIYQAALGAWHSVSDAHLGESDIVFLFEAMEGPRTAILIENKIDAPPQPRQGERYRLRGEKGTKEGYWERFKTCVIAPSKYLASAKHSEHSESYDASVSYEEILAYFQSRSPRSERFSYKARILLEGIEQNRRGYQPEFNRELTTFVADYYAFASAKHPELGMQEAKPRPAASTWIAFYPRSLPKEVYLVHQLTTGFVKAFFNGRAESFDGLKEKYSGKLPPGASIAVAGKSVSISMDVPKLDPHSRTFTEQQDVVVVALQRLVVLERLVAENSGVQ
ncbi:MAG: hypothetical protein KDA44_03450 [Planctomycetales bacterium]|nr:hypothetical protein [Planctomycetales bacterium]